MSRKSQTAKLTIFIERNCESPQRKLQRSFNLFLLNYAGDTIKVKLRFDRICIYIQREKENYKTPFHFSSFYRHYNTHTQTSTQFLCSFLRGFCVLIHTNYTLKCVVEVDSSLSLYTCMTWFFQHAIRIKKTKEKKQNKHEFIPISESRNKNPSKLKRRVKLERY